MCSVCGTFYFAGAVSILHGLVNMTADMGKDISAAMHLQSRCPRKPGTFIILFSQRVGEI